MHDNGSYIVITQILPLKKYWKFFSLVVGPKSGTSSLSSSLAQSVEELQLLRHIITAWFRLSFRYNIFVLWQRRC